MNMPIALRLATRQWAARPLRPILCSLAIAAAVALIVCVGVAMDSLRYTLSAAIGRALGVAEVHIRPSQGGTDARVPQSILDRVRALPEVDFAAGRLHSFAALTKGDDHLWYDVLGVDLNYDEKLRPKTFRAGHTLSTDPQIAASQILIDSQVAEKLSLNVGDKVAYAENDTSTRTVEVVGILARPNLEILSKPTLYVPLQSLAKDMNVAGEYNVIDIKLKDSSGIDDFDQYAKTLGATLGPIYEVSPGTTSKANLSQFTRTLRLLLLLLSTMSAFCSALIIGTTLSVGIQERVRQFGQLRCIGASRGQLALFLLGDGAVMLVIGESLGLILGFALSSALIAWLPQFFSAYQLSLASLSIAIFCGGFATLLGAAIPIWQVTRVSPMAAVTAVANQTRPSRIWLAAAIGLGCLALQATLWNVIPARDFRFYTYVILGIPLIFSGWCLLAPAFLVFSERFAAQLLGRLLSIRPTLLRHAWSRTPWRAGAMIAALMIGVTLFTTIRARGQSLLASWTAPARIPDIIVKKPFAGGFTDNNLAILRKKHPELRDIAVFDYFGVSLSDKLFQLGGLFKEGETTFIAVDPQVFTKMVELEYLQGDPATAVQQLSDGRHLFVSKEFYNVRKLGVGDHINLRGADGKPVQFTIAAVVTSTGVELIQNFFDLRTSFSEKATSSVLGTVADAHKYFQLGDPTLFLADVTPETLQPIAMAKLRDDMTNEGLLSFSSVELKTSLINLITRLINGLSVVGIGALCVASLGVANMVIASVHAKRFEFGVLRAIGAGRAQLVRLVLAEVTLIGIVSGFLGAAAGLHYAYMAGQVDLLLIGFPTRFLAAHPFDIFLGILFFIGLAIALTTLLAWLASLAPAIKGAFSAQRTLLASGRM